MNLKLVRRWFTENSTIGELFVNSQFEFYTLEDAVREGPKVPGKTAIPEGTYQVIITYSQRFKRDMPLLIGVPGFTGIRIHSGNIAEHTEGCILVGKTHDIDFVGKSREAYGELFRKIQFALNCGENCSITVKTEVLV